MRARSLSSSASSAFAHSSSTATTTTVVPTTSHTYAIMASAATLRTLLLSVFSPRGLQNGEQEFFEELMAHKPQLVILYDVGARNSQEQRELESGALMTRYRVDCMRQHLRQGRLSLKVAPSR